MCNYHTKKRPKYATAEMVVTSFWYDCPKEAHYTPNLFTCQPHKQAAPSLIILPRIGLGSAALGSINRKFRHMVTWHLKAFWVFFNLHHGY